MGWNKRFFFYGPGYHSLIGPYYGKGVDWISVMEWNKLDSSNGMEPAFFCLRPRLLFSDWTLLLDRNGLEFSNGMEQIGF